MLPCLQTFAKPRLAKISSGCWASGVGGVSAKPWASGRFRLPRRLRLGCTGCSGGAALASLLLPLRCGPCTAASKALCSSCALDAASLRLDGIAQDPLSDGEPASTPIGDTGADRVCDGRRHEGRSRPGSATILISQYFPHSLR